MNDNSTSQLVGLFIISQYVLSTIVIAHIKAVGPGNLNQIMYPKVVDLKNLLCAFSYGYESLRHSRFR